MLEELDKGHLILELKGNWWKLSDISFSGVSSTLRAPVVWVGHGAPHLDHGAGQTLADHVVTCKSGQNQSRLFRDQGIASVQNFILLKLIFDYKLWSFDFQLPRRLFQLQSWSYSYLALLEENHPASQDFRSGFFVLAFVYKKTVILRLFDEENEKHFNLSWETSEFPFSGVKMYVNRQGENWPLSESFSFQKQENKKSDDDGEEEN